MATDAGVEVMQGRTDFDKIRQELATAGYKQGDPAGTFDDPVAACRESQVAGGCSCGAWDFDVDYQALEWGMVVARRASKEPPDKGGSNVFITNLTSFNNIFVPAQIRHPQRSPMLGSLAESAKRCAKPGDTFKPRRNRTHRARHGRTAWQDVPYSPLGLFLAYGVQKDPGRRPMGWPVFHSTASIGKMEVMR